jgi:hypothetical protein
VKSKRVFLVVCGAVGVVHCGGELYVGDTGAGAPATASTSGRDDTELTGGSAGNAQKGGGRSNAAGSAGRAGSNRAGAGAAGGARSGDAGSALTAGVGDEAGKGATSGQSGSGGDDAGVLAAPCDCGSTTTLAPVDCQAGDGYNATLTDDGSIVLYITTNASSYESGLWTVQEGTVYKAHRAMAGLSADGQTSLFNTESGAVALHLLDGHDTLLPLWSGDYLGRDGLTVVGRVETASAEQIVTWTAAGGIVTPDFGVEQAGVYAIIRALNRDASALGGGLWDGTNYVPFIWSAADTHRLADPLAENDPTKSPGFVSAMSDDGSVAAGIIATGETDNSPQPLLYALFRWTEEAGVTRLGPCRIADRHGACDGALFVSSDGTALAGSIGIGDGSMLGKAFRWTNAGLSYIDADEYTVVRGMSADGNVIAGNAIDIDTGNVTMPFVWTTSVGTQDLAARLASAGADLGGWTLGEVAAISHDGSVIVGNGTCNGVPALYRAYLPR